ncbi:MAG: hypothetical protein ABJC36_13505 [Gemmatimonadales bacterium]
MRGAMVLILILLAAPGQALPAQRIPSNPFPRAEFAPANQPLTQATLSAASGGGDEAKLVFAGVLGAVAGFAIGAVSFQSRSCGEEDCWVPAFYAAMAGESLGVPVAVHLANGRRGRPGRALLASLAIGGGGLGVAMLCNEPRLLLAIPVGQIASAIAIERSTVRDRE